VALAVALVMTPAALHRRHGSREVTDTFIHVSSLLLLASMVPLAAGLALDFHLIAKLILEDGRIAMVCGVTLFTLLLAFWFAFPRAERLLDALASLRERLAGDK